MQERVNNVHFFCHIFAVRCICWFSLSHTININIFSMREPMACVTHCIHFLLTSFRRAATIPQPYHIQYYLELVTNVSTGHFFWVQYYSLKRNGKVKYLVDPFTGIAMIFRPLISFSLDFSTAIKIRPPLHTQENYNNKIKWKKTKRNCQPIAFHTVYSVHKWNICSFVCICMFFFVLQFFVSFCHLTQCMNLFILLP